ncbi:MAG TPA: CheR family methyltransferase [Opitutaceae bacterium]
MAPSLLEPVLLRAASRWVAEHTGLAFPEERWPDLQRGLAAAAHDLGFDGPRACAEGLLAQPPSQSRLEALARHLTVGETYFFRDRRAFEALTGTILPEIARARGEGRSLRMWSAGCCTGEEAYSLAIALRQAVPDLADWQVTLLATDLNPEYLRKAKQGEYGEWSFRDAPAGFKESYFTVCSRGRYRIRPDIAQMVTFDHLNLASDEGPPGMDVIFCRNVFMYFTPGQAANAIARLHRALADTGVLLVGPSESSQALFPQFGARNFPGATAYVKHRPARPATMGAGSPPPPGGLSETRGRPAPRPAAPPARPAYAATHPAPVPPDFRGQARGFADRGNLAEALASCEDWLRADKLNPAGHYLRAVVRIEQGDDEDARRSLRRALYLDPQFVMAHVALGNLDRAAGRLGAAQRHFAAAQQLLARRPQEEALPESDGLTAGRLADTLTSLGLASAAS